MQNYVSREIEIKLLVLTIGLQLLSKTQFAIFQIFQI